MLDLEQLPLAKAMLLHDDCIMSSLSIERRFFADFRLGWFVCEVRLCDRST